MKEKKETKVNEIDNVDNPILKEIRAIKLEHSTELAAICAEVLQIKEAVNSRNNFCRKHVSRCPNCTVTKSNCSHCFECGSSEDQKSVCLHHDKAKVAQVRHAATVSIKITCNIRCVCKKRLKFYINVRHASQETITRKHVRLNSIRNTRNIEQLFQN